MKKSERSYWITLAFAFFLGTFGVHRFYVGKVGTGLLMIFTLGGLGIWTVIDLILITFGAFRDKEGNEIRFWEKEIPMT